MITGISHRSKYSTMIKNKFGLFQKIWFLAYQIGKAAQLNTFMRFKLHRVVLGGIWAWLFYLNTAFWFISEIIHVVRYVVAHYILPN